jgi:hypothetical protein
MIHFAVRCSIEWLAALKIPFVFVTGYGAAGMFPAAFARRPRLPKPYAAAELKALLYGRSAGAAKG